MQRVLYIEDDILLQRSFKRALEREFDCEVTTASDAPTAIRILEAAEVTFGCFHYDHILSDFELLNGTTGAEVFAWLNARSNDKTASEHGVLKSPREVYLERFTFLTSREEVLVLHNRFIEKPATAKTVTKAMQTKGPLIIRAA